MSNSLFDLEPFVDQMAIVLNLPIRSEYRPGIVDNFERITTIAQSVLEFPLPETVTAAAVFYPGGKP